MRDFPGNQLLRVDFLNSEGLKACRNFVGEGGLVPPLLSVRLPRLAWLLDLLFDLASGLLSDTLPNLLSSLPFELVSGMLSDTLSSLLSSLLSEILLDGELGSVGKGFRIGGDGCEMLSGEVATPFEETGMHPGSG